MFIPVVTLVLLLGWLAVWALPLLPYSHRQHWHSACGVHVEHINDYACTMFVLRVIDIDMTEMKC